MTTSTSPSLAAMAQTSAQRLPGALDHSLESAWMRANSCVSRANSLCALAACGAERDIPAVIQSIHAAGFALMTMSETGAFLGVYDAERAHELAWAAERAQQAALAFERAHRADQLSPAQLHVDEFLNPETLGPRPEPGQDANTLALRPAQFVPFAQQGNSP